MQRRLKRQAIVSASSWQSVALVAMTNVTDYVAGLVNNDTTNLTLLQATAERLMTRISELEDSQEVPALVSLSSRIKSLFRHCQVTDLDVTDLGFSGPRVPF